MSRVITCNQIKSLKKKKDLPTNKIPGPDSITGEFYQTSEEVTPIFLKLSQKIKENSF